MVPVTNVDKKDKNVIFAYTFIYFFEICPPHYCGSEHLAMVKSNTGDKPRLNKV